MHKIAWEAEDSSYEFMRLTESKANKIFIVLHSREFDMWTQILTKLIRLERETKLVR